MSESNEMNVDLPAVLGALSQFGALSTSIKNALNALENASDLSWAGNDGNGQAIKAELEPAEQGSEQALTATAQAVDGLVDSLATTAGLWNKTEGTNVELNM